MDQNRCMPQLLLGAALAALLAVVPVTTAPRADAPPPEAASATVVKQPVRAVRQMVASANPRASEVGLEVLRAGGSAVDAAVAVQLMLNLVEPQSSGLGGGAFLVHYDAASGVLTTLDGREKAPMAAGSDLFLKPDGEPMEFWDAVIGGRSVGVPGTPALLHAAHQRWGRLPWAELFEPTIQLAEEGFAISPRLAEAIAGSRGLDSFAPTRAYFFEADGSPKQAGAVLRNPEFAATLRSIASDGPAAFYHGPIAEAIVAAVTGGDNAGVMKLEDLAAYEVVERAPVCATYREHRVCGMGPPSSGGLAVGQILGLLEGFDLAAAGPSVEAAHLFLEASRLAYADRDHFVADADFVSVPVEGMLDHGYLATRAALIDPAKSMGKAAPGEPPRRQGALPGPHNGPDRPATSHFVVVDADGNAVSMTTTIEAGMGSRVMAAGFLLNNELTDFAFRPEVNGRPVANRVEPGKRPRSSMAPTIVLGPDGEPTLLVGSPGGARIIPYVAKTIVAVLDWGMDPQAAIDFGHMVNRNGDTELEQETVVAAWQAELEALGHTVSIREQASGLHAILIGADGLVGGADPRREGTAIGD